MMAAGKLGKIALDTNILSPILDGASLSEWLVAVLKQSAPAVCHWSVVEYVCSTPVEERLAEDEILASLENQGIKLLGGPCAGRESFALTMRFMAEKHNAIFTTPKNSRRYAQALTRAQSRKYLRIYC
ncbi:hypothetical protein TWF696_004991 [Orbilia brochopaga]|uniref:PIN domain-containing protein n=1 Tax=Orbilia brochopaga TaxID=3140254 RepID=A0AAV9V107_9PEZI